MLNSFNHELQLKCTEYAIREELIDLLSELEGFKIVKILALEFTKMETNDKTKYRISYLNLKSRNSY